MKTAALALLTAIVLPAACAPAPAAPTPPGAAEASTLAQSRAADSQPGRFERIETLGDACDGTAASAISPDGQAFTTIFSEFVAAAGPNTPPEQASRGCLLLARVEVPAGWQYSIESLDYRGFVALEDDVTATRSSLYVISGNDAKVPPPVELEGEIEGEDFIHSDVGPGKRSGWSECGEGQDLWVAIRAEVDNSEDDDNSGQLAIDSVDGELQWRECE